jgi:hypothetical protein
VAKADAHDVPSQFRKEDALPPGQLVPKFRQVQQQQLLPSGQRERE